MKALPASMIDAQLDTLEELYRRELPQIILGAQDCPLPGGIRRVYALGNGDSYHAAVAAAQAFAQWDDMEYIPMPAYTFLTKELPRLRRARADQTLVACVSASGSSRLAVSVLEGVRAAQAGKTLSIAGKPGCAMDAAAEWTLSTAISEKGRSPGIRTYAASLCGLLALAERLGSGVGWPGELAGQLETSAPQLARVVEASRAIAVAAAGWDWPLAAILGCDGLLGCAHFVAAKLAEGCGVFAAGQELEEWCHVESMTYPLGAPVMILAGEGTHAQAAKAARVARRAGRPVAMVSMAADAALAEVADLYLPLDVGVDDMLAALYAYIPGTALARALADKYGRAMFLSDQPINLFE